MGMGLPIIARSLITVGFLWLLMRVGGKRQLRELGMMDFVAAFLLGSLAADNVLGNVPLATGIVGMGVVAWAHLLTTRWHSRHAARPYRAKPDEQEERAWRKAA